MKAEHESGRPLLDASQARRTLGWQPRWGFSEAVGCTAGWYWAVAEGSPALDLCLEQLQAYEAGGAAEI